MLQPFQKRIAAFIPQKGGKIGNIGIGAGQGMGLRISQHLQSVFGLPQMMIMGSKRGLLIGADPAFRSKAGKGIKGARQAQ